MDICMKCVFEGERDLVRKRRKRGRERPPKDDLNRDYGSGHTIKG